MTTLALSYGNYLSYPHLYLCSSSIYFLFNFYICIFRIMAIIFKDLLDPTIACPGQKDWKLNTVYVHLNNNNLISLFCANYGSICNPPDFDHIKYILENLRHYFLYSFRTGNDKGDHLIISVSNLFYTITQWK